MMDGQKVSATSAPVSTADMVTFVLEREVELTVLLSAVSQSSERSQFVYVWGPPASGKTVLMHQLAQRLSNGERVLLYTSVSGEGAVDQVQIDLSRQLDSFDTAPDYSGLVDNLTKQAASGGFVWVLDGYGDHRDQDRWFREHVFPKIPVGGTVVLTGRRAPTQLWAGNRLWRQSVRNVELRDLSENEAIEFLVASGVEDGVHRAEATRLSGGRLGLLVRATDALRVLEGQERVSPGAHRRHRGGNDTKLASYLVEHILYPGSRRASWRAGVGRDSVDTLLAAAALLPTFHRNILISMVGRPMVDAFWEHLVELPVVQRFEGGMCAIPEPLRQRMEGLVHQLRPWTVEQWRKAALAYLVAETHDGDDSDFGRIWADIAHLARQNVWDGALHPLGDAPEPWRFQWDDLGRVENQGACSIRYGALESADQNESVHDSPEALVAIDRGGVVVGYVTVDVNRSSIRRVLRVTALAISPGARGLERALVRELAAEWGHYDRVEWCAVTHPQGEDLLSVIPALELLQFRPEDHGADRRGWVLNLEDTTYHDWLASVVHRVREHPELDTRVNMVREALAAIHSPEALMRTALARRFSQSRVHVSPGQVRTWIVDALTSADLGEWPSGRVLLTLYYLDRSGSHETLAEQLNVSRATYFRSHRRAIAMLADALFDVCP